MWLWSLCQSDVVLVAWTRAYLPSLWGWLFLFDCIISFPSVVKVDAAVDAVYYYDTYYVVMV